MGTISLYPVRLGLRFLELYNRDLAQGFCVTVIVGILMQTMGLQFRVQIPVRYRILQVIAPIQRRIGSSFHHVLYNIL